MRTVTAFTVAAVTGVVNAAVTSVAVCDYTASATRDDYADFIEGQISTTGP